MFKTIFFFLLSVLFIVKPAQSSQSLTPLQMQKLHVEAWIKLRTQFDSIAYAHIHPNYLEHWLDAAPVYILEDIIRISREPIIVYEAALRLARENPQSVHLIKKIAESFSDTHISFLFNSLRILAGDKEYKKRLEKQLESPSFVIRLEAAKVLIFAGNVAASKEVEEQVNKCRPTAPVASRILARSQNPQKQTLLERAIKKGCYSEELKAASGELLFSKNLPLHYKMMNRRDMSGTRYDLKFGMYDVWMMVYRDAALQNMGTQNQLISYLKSFRNYNSMFPHISSAVIRRYLDSFIEFVVFTNERISSSQGPLYWPQTMQEAHLVYSGKKSVSGIDSFVREISYALKVLVETSDYYLKPNEHTFEKSTPAKGTARMQDGNYNTSWYTKAGDIGVVKLPEPKKISKVLLAPGMNCTLGQATIALFHGDKLLKEKKINLMTPYYQEINFSPLLLTNLTIKIKDSTAKKLCFSEIRFF